MSAVMKVLKEYVDMLPHSFTKMKGIKGKMGEMKIEIKLDSKPIRKQPYQLNPRIKKNVTEETDKTLATKLIFPL